MSPHSQCNPASRAAQISARSWPADRTAHLFLVGEDYHLGDLLWLTVVLGAYRAQHQPARLLVGCPDRPISRILEQNPLIDELLYGEPARIRAAALARFGASLVIRDLRPLPLALGMLRAWRRRWPWLYYRDLWLQARGQWLATYLRLGPLHSFRPILELRDEDLRTARTLPRPYVALAPHIGEYRLPLAGWLWRRVKGWEWGHWSRLASLVRAAGYEPVTLAAAGQAAIPATRPLLGLPIRQVAGVVSQAAALVTAESGLWFVAAACRTPFVIVPWWLPRSVDWAAPLQVPYRLVARGHARPEAVLAALQQLIAHGRP